MSAPTPSVRPSRKNLGSPRYTLTWDKYHGHEVIHEFIDELAATYDQVNLGNLALGEACMIDVMVVEEMYKDRTVSGNDARLNEMNFFGARSSGARCAYILELMFIERRKAREERAFLTPDPKGKS